MEGATARRLLQVEGVDYFIANAAPEKRADAEAKLRTLCNEGGLMLQSFADLRQRVDEMTTGVIAGLWGLLVLGLVVGAFAIANTLDHERLGADPRTGAAARGGHDPLAGPQDDLRPGRHYRLHRAGHRHGRRRRRRLRHESQLAAAVWAMRRFLPCTRRSWRPVSPSVWR